MPRSFFRIEVTAPSLVALCLAAGVCLGCGGGDNQSTGDGDGGGKTIKTGLDGGGVPDLSITGPDSGSVQEVVLYSLSSVQGVSRNPPVATVFTLTQAAYITRVFTYHYGSTIAGKGATVAFKDTTTGAIIGPWPQVGYTSFAGTLGATQSDPGNVPGPPDNYWMAYPGQSVPAGTYQVIDSDPTTWCYTVDTGARGIAWVWGRLGGAPSATLDGGVQIDAPVISGAGLDGGGLPLGRGSPGTPGPVLATWPVSPASGTVTFGLDGGINVTIPMDAATTATAAIVSTLTGSEPGSPKIEEIIASYEVSIGTQHNFTPPLTIDIPYDVTKLPNDLVIPHRVLLSPAYFDTTQKEWVEMAYKVDPARGIVTVTTDHLCSLAVRTMLGAMGCPAPAIAGTLRITGDGDNRLVWENQGRFHFFFNTAETNDNTGAKGIWYHTDDSINPAIADLPVFVKDAIPYFQHAAVAYAKFRQPEHQRVVISDVTSSSRSKITGDISLRFSSSPVALKMDSAHEYFHSVQNKYFNIMGMSARKWWIEATADYAADVVAWGGIQQMGGEVVSPRYMEKALTYAAPLLSVRDVLKAATDALVRENLLRDDPHSYHEYTTAHFISFLVARRGVAFLDLWEGVAAQSTDARTALDATLRALTGRGLGAHYRDFARFWAFDATSPVRTILKKTVLDVEDPRLSQRVEDVTKSLSLSVVLEGEHSAKIIGLAAPATGAKRSLRISAPSLPTDTLIDVYASTASETFSLVGSLELATATLDAAFGAGTDLYLLVVNNATSSATVPISITEVTTTVPPPPTAKTYTMTYRLENSPSDSCSRACGDISTPTTGVAGTLSTANGSATLTSIYTKTDKLGDAVSCSVNATGTWNATSLGLSLTGSFSCVANTHKEAGTFSSQSEWIDMGNGYLQLMTTPTWTATFASSDVDAVICGGMCAGDVMFKPSRLTP
jgi:hypothetical protein